jgi:hypothetical protein
MLMIENTLVSEEIFEEQFVCNLNSCKGQCCISGDSGAPLEKHETKLLDEIYPKIKPYLSAESIEEIEKQGTWIIDNEGDFVTPLINKEERCVYVVFDKNQIAKCAIEQAFEAGAVPFKKPISCHLYPIRITKTSEYDLLNYNRWSICADACKLGKELKVPVFRFLKEPLIRKYGQEYYQMLEDYNHLIKK